MEENGLMANQSPIIGPGQRRERVKLFRLPLSSVENHQSGEVVAYPHSRPVGSSGPPVGRHSGSPISFVSSSQYGGGSEELPLCVEGVFGVMSLSERLVNSCVLYHVYRGRAHSNWEISLAPPYGGMHRERLAR
jgi:hypothetical protein